MNVRFLQLGLGGGTLAVSQVDRASLVTGLGEIPHRDVALREVFDALKPGGILSVTEVIVDPHFQSRDTVVRLAGAVGFKERAFFGNRFAFTLNLQKPYFLDAATDVSRRPSRTRPCRIERDERFRIRRWPSRSRTGVT